MMDAFTSACRRSCSIGNGSRRVSIVLFMFLVHAFGPIQAADAQALKLGDILVTEPGSAAISVIDSATGVKTVISQGGLLSPSWKTIGVALALDGDVIAVHRLTGLIRINVATGAQSILSQGGLFSDPWAIAIDKDTGYIYVADSGYDNDRSEINEPGKIIRVDPASGAQQLIASGSPCTQFPSNAACQNTTSAGSLPRPSVRHRHRLCDLTGLARRSRHEFIQWKGSHRTYPALSRWRADSVVGSGVRRAGATGRPNVSSWMSDGCCSRAQREHFDDSFYLSSPCFCHVSSAARNHLWMRGTWHLQN